jgi:hypothetical protein
MRPKPLLSFAQDLLARDADIGEEMVVEVAQVAALPPQLQRMAATTAERSQPVQ